MLRACMQQNYFKDKNARFQTQPNQPSHWITLGYIHSSTRGYQPENLKKDKTK
jgi:hypothetical protein